MKLVFLHTSDIHGYLLSSTYQNKTDYDAKLGLDRVSSVVKAKRAEYGANHVIVTDAGDCLQGSPLAAYVHASNQASALKQYAAAYNALDYDARCLGNHDFNYGLGYLKDYLTATNTPILNSNILPMQQDISHMGQPYQIIEKQGIKIGLLGITTQYVPHWEPADHVAGLKFVSAYEQVKSYAKLLRPQVDVLAVIYHGGFEDDPVSGKQQEPHTGENEGYQILTKIPEVDVLLTGHQHQQLALTVNNTAIVQPGYRGEAVAEVIIEIDDTTKTIKHMKTELISTENFKPDPVIVALSSKLDAATQDWLDQPIAQLDQAAPIGDVNQARLHGAPFINLLQQMQLSFTKADISATAVMSETAPGFGKQVTMRDILLNYPFSNQLCKVAVTGSQLRQIVEYSLSFLIKDGGKVLFAPKWHHALFNFDVFYPLEYQADIARPVGNRLTKFSLNNQPIDDKRVYYLAVNNYRVMGGGFYPVYSMDKIVEVLDKDYVQMFQEFLTKQQVKVDYQTNYRFY
ncbi:bifunctional UDP-sugar hydrolase/5'-nucleotidase [Lactobacillus sp. ESL0681]|uniref:bifunctional metallophosphatase/5'-nucleotidase n=1 Tax=Lactobacillus sp. ESL0681 TaxID=2983211 RepID=UPI0023F7FF1C|nr:bifunctional UDP-sugar hydrolase/5'-nucleotidase [Lactobacillus sp. ESL0681]WEV40633.1 bifunctional UDP-sugar hydrolase/5'-nucleotidase [Lactobacillus sp. ESL0681]